MQRQTETVHFMQVVPWLGVVPNKEGQLQQMLADDNFSPLVSLFKLATDEVLSNPTCINPTSYISMAKQAEVAGAYSLLSIRVCCYFQLYCHISIITVPFSPHLTCSLWKLLLQSIDVKLATLNMLWVEDGNRKQHLLGF